MKKRVCGISQICSWRCFLTLICNHLDIWYLYIYIHFSFPSNFLPFVYLDVFSLSQFCFDGYLSFILAFLPHYCDSLSDTSERPFGNISIYMSASASTLQHFIFLLQNYLKKIKHLWPIQILCSIIWYQYHFTITLLSFFIPPEASINILEKRLSECLELLSS